MGDVFNSIGNAIGSAVDGLESVGGDVLQVGGKLLSNPAIDTALGSMIGCPELGMIAPIISGLTSQGGSASPTSLGQMPGMFGGSNPFGGVGSGGYNLNNIFGGNGFPPIFGGGAGVGAGSGLPVAGGFDPNAGVTQLLGDAQAQFKFQQQMTAISEAFNMVSKELSMSQDMAKTALQNIH